MLYRIVLSALIFSLGTASLSFAAQHVVVQKGKVFDVPEIAIKAGDSILFKNEDDVTHNVFSHTADMRFNVKKQEPGSEEAVTFDKTGSAKVRCVFHPTMKLTIKVQ